VKVTYYVSAAVFHCEDPWRLSSLVVQSNSSALLASSQHPIHTHPRVTTPKFHWSVYCVTTAQLSHITVWQSVLFTNTVTHKNPQKLPNFQFTKVHIVSINAIYMHDIWSVVIMPQHCIVCETLSLVIAYVTVSDLELSFNSVTTVKMDVHSIISYAYPG